MNWELGASTWGDRYNDVNFFECCQKNGIKYIEIAPAFNYRGVNVLYEVYTSIDFKQIKRFADETHIKLWSYHLPFDPDGANLVSLDKELRNSSIELCCEMIKKFSDIGIKIGVLHPSVGGYSGEDRVERIKYSSDSVFKINRVAKECGVTIAVENLPPRATSDKSADLVEILKCDESLRVCFDVNHLFHETHNDFIDALGQKIITLHISDYDFEDERHWLPGQGKINWNELVTLLNKINYKGVFMNEIDASCLGVIDGGKYSLAELKDANHRILKAKI